jgi:hypothetical protein
VQPTGTGVATWADTGAMVNDNRLSPITARIVMRTCKPASDALFWINSGLVPIR